MSETNDFLNLEFSEPLQEDVNDFVIDKNKIKVYIAGDSTACNYPHTGNPNRYPRTGWGQVFGELFNDDVQVVNCAISGRSSKSFKTEVNFGYICDNISNGDYLIIQFAHNDSKESDRSRYTSPADGTYQSSIYEFINAARKNGANPILATSVTRNVLSDDTLIPYGDALKEIGAKENIPVLDIYALSNAELKRTPDTYGKYHMNIAPRDGRFTDFPEFANSEYYSEGSRDNTHLNIFGARFIASLAAAELKRLGHPLAKSLKNIYK